MTMRRIFGMAMLAAALLFGVVDILRTVMPSYGDQGLTFGRLWLLASARSLAFTESLITQHLWSPIWNIGIWPVLVAPAWSCCLALGFLFFVLGRPRAAR